MRKIIFSVFLLLGVVSLSACSLNAPQEEIANTYVNNPKSSKLLDGKYTLNAEESSLTWSANKVLSGHTGKVAIKSGEVNIVDGELENIANVVIDMTTISDDGNSEALVKHLNSADFFDTANFPESNLNIVSMTSSGINQYNIEADLTIKGITNRISFPAEIITKSDVLTAKANFEINRTLWDIKYNSASFLSDLGDKAIDDTIKFQIEVKADKSIN